MHIHTLIHTDKRTRTHRLIHIHTCTYTHTYNTQRCTCTHIHAHTHSYTHTHTTHKYTKSETIIYKQKTSRRKKIKNAQTSNMRQKKINLQIHYWVHFVLAFCCWAWGLKCGFVYPVSPWKNTNFSHASCCQLEIASSLVVKSCAHFLLSVLRNHLACCAWAIRSCWRFPVASAGDEENYLLQANKI